MDPVIRRLVGPTRRARRYARALGGTTLAAAFLATVAYVAIGGAPPARKDRPSAQDRLHAKRLARLHAVCSWAPVIGGFDLRSLGDFDLVVVDGVRQRDGSVDASARDVRALHKRGALVLAYLSVGTVEDWRHYAPRVSDRWKLGQVPGWKGEQYVDVRSRGWQEMMVREAGALAAVGFDGLYLDNLDVAEVAPATRRGVIALVRKLRAAVPPLLLVGQNGLVVADRLPIDAIAHEDVWWGWTDSGYTRTPPEETASRLRKLRRLRARGVPVLTLDYAPRGSPSAREVLTRSLREGFRPAVSVPALDRPPHGVARC